MKNKDTQLLEEAYGQVSRKIDLMMVDDLIKELQRQKSNGVVRLVFTTPNESQDFVLTKIEQNQEDDLAFAYLNPVN